jgi:RNA polymerase sigma-70 factor (ECF subfamily)
MEGELLEQSLNNPSTFTHVDDRDAHALYRTLHQDKQAFGEIVQSYTPVFYSLLRRLSPDRSIESIEDDLQEIFLRIYRALATYKSDRSFFSWAYTIAMNWIRSKRRKLYAGRTSTTVSYDEDIKILQGKAYSESPEDVAISVEAERLLLKALRELRPAYREVFVLRMMQHLSVQDTAHVLHIPEGTVKTHLHRARKALQDWFSEHRWELKY